MSKKLPAEGFAVLELPKPPPRVALPEVTEFEAKTMARRPPRESPLRRTERGQRVVVYLPDEVEGDLRVHCGHERCSISWAITRAVQEYLEKHSTVGT